MDNFLKQVGIFLVLKEHSKSFDKIYAGLI